jgi:lysophospholipase L1-like esterase
VNCTATDALQRRATCSFKITVVEPPTISHTKFVTFGDSITEGDDGFNQLAPLQPAPLLDRTRAYAMFLKAMLVQTFAKQQDVIEVFNEGQRAEFAGDPETLQRFHQKVFLSNAEVVLLMEGTNDITYPDFKNLSREASANRAIANLGAMIDEARQANKRVFLATIAPQRQPTDSCPPIPDCRGRGWDYVPVFNDRIRQLARSKNVELVDVHAALDLSYIGPDGLHPTDAGFQKIAEAFFLRLRQTLGSNALAPPGLAWSYGRFPDR